MKRYERLTFHSLYFKSACLLTLTLIIITGCRKDELETLPFEKQIGDGEFYRLADFGTLDVIPENRQVRVLVRVTDSLNFGVTDLEKGAFEVLENNIDKVNDVEAETRIDPEIIPYTIKTVLLLDLSSSVESKIEEIKSAVKNLIQSKVANQQFAIYTFDSKVTKLLDFTEKSVELYDAIESLPENDFDNSTNLYRAIIETSKIWENKIEIDEIEEGSMIIFTDGKHNADPKLFVEDVLNELGEKSVYVAALNGQNLDEDPLKQIAGNEKRYFFADDIDALSEVFLGIQDRILTQSRSIYYITYTSPISVPGVQNLKVLIKNNRNPEGDCMIEQSFSTNEF